MIVYDIANVVDECTIVADNDDHDAVVDDDVQGNDVCGLSSSDADEDDSDYDDDGIYDVNEC